MNLLTVPTSFNSYNILIDIDKEKYKNYCLNLGLSLSISERGIYISGENFFPHLEIDFMSTYRSRSMNNNEYFK